MPEEAAVTTFDFCIRRLLETLLFAIALNAEDVLDLEIQGECLEFG